MESTLVQLNASDTLCNTEVVTITLRQDNKDIIEEEVNEAGETVMNNTQHIYNILEAKPLAPTVANIKHALYENNGNLLKTCVTMRWDKSCKHELYRWIKKLNLVQDVAVARDQLVDKAEAVINEGLEQNDLDTAKFVLKTQGKYRGWDEKSEDKIQDVYNTVITSVGETEVDFTNMDELNLSEYITNKIRDGRTA
jgi:hypothetical protein